MSFANLFDRSESTKMIWIICFCYAITAFIFSINLGMTEQESYYWLWSKNLDWSYFDHPPLQAWTTFVLTYFFGDEKWVVRLPAFFGSLATFFLFFNWVRTKWGEASARFAALLLLSSNVFLFGSIIALPDSLAVPLGLAAMTAAEKCHIKKVGLFLGLALLAKWTIVLIFPGIVYQFYKQKKINQESLFWIFVIPLLFHAPVLWWNFTHGGASLKFHLFDRHIHEFQELRIYFDNFEKFILSQIFAIGLISSTLLFLASFGLIRKDSQELERADLKTMLIWTLPGLAVFFASALQGQIRYYWTFLSWLPCLALLAHFIAVTYAAKIQLFQIGTITFIVFKWCLAGFAGFYPIGPTVEAIFNLKTDMRHSPLGEIAGWNQWIENELRPKHLISNQIALIGSDFHVTARMAWALRKDHIENIFGVAGSKKNQFQFWKQPLPPRFTTALFFGDNRYNEIIKFENLCDDKLNWKTSDIKISGETIKEIYWSQCMHLRSVNVLSQNFSKL